jgi:hypothetical protein
VLAFVTGRGFLFDVRIEDMLGQLVRNDFGAGFYCGCMFTLALFVAIGLIDKFFMR